MTIAEIAKERGVTAREVFVEEIEKRGFELLSDPLDTQSGYIKIHSMGIAKSTVTDIWCSLSCGSAGGWRKIPYTAITIDLINAVAGEPKC